MTWDAATITAVGTAAAAVGGIIVAVLKVVFTRPRMPVAEELLTQLDEMRDDLLALAKWAHRARAQAAAAGLDLEDPPDILRSAGRRDGERRHDDASHGWRSSVKAQTGETPAVTVQPEPADGPQTWPERRRPKLTPPPADVQPSRPVPPLPGRHRGDDPDSTTRIR